MAALRYLSVCSGIEAATVAWHPLGWQPVAFSEIEKFPSQVLAHHYPNVPNLGDMTKFEEWTNVSDVDVLVGGTPCQSFSVAGLRKGLHDPRGGLMLTFLEIAQRHRPRWIVWENVPGVLSSNGGRDFGSFLAALGELGYGWAYRVLDAQWFGVAQRRRRVFVVGCLGDQRSAAKVLFESESVCRNTPPSREKKQDVASTITSSLGSGGPNDMTPMVASGKPTFPTLMANAGTKLWLGNQEAFSGDYHILQPVALAENTIGRQPLNGGNGDGFTVGGPMYTLNATGVHGVSQQMAVRRLTPMECERLQGFLDGYTDIKENTPDGPRYKALGNSMAVPVMRWIGERINAA